LPVFLASFVIFLYRYSPHGHLHSFPTRRSSDLAAGTFLARSGSADPTACHRARRQDSRCPVRTSGPVPASAGSRVLQRAPLRREDRKSTRLNSSHLVISYAVFCLKKKNNDSLPL